MRVLVTGAGGFVGRHLVRELADAGHEVTGTVRAAADGVGLDPRVVVAVADLLDDDALRSAVAQAMPEAVVHLAGQASAAAAQRATGETMRTNVEGTSRLAEALAAGVPGARVVLAGSAEVYGNAGGAAPVREDAPLAPIGPYGASKVCQEVVLAEAAARAGLSLRVARAFNHTGPGQAPRFALPSFAAQIAAAERDGGGVIRVGNLEAVRDFSDVRDVVRAYRLLVEHDAAGAEPLVVNVASGRGHRVRELLDLLVAAASVPVRVETDPARMRAADVPVLIGDRSRAESVLSWVPEIPLERTVADLLDWSRVSNPAA